jgi:hypothetical protein
MVLRTKASALVEGLPVQILPPGAYSLVLVNGERKMVMRFVKAP